MRILLGGLCALALMGCSSSDSNGNGNGGGFQFPDVGIHNALTASCSGAQLVVHGAAPLPDGKTIASATVVSANVDFVASTLTGTLSDGGTMSLHWKGDAKAGSVSVYGSIVWGSSVTGEKHWCIDEESRIHFTSDNAATFEIFDVALGAQLVADEKYSSCHAPPDASGVPAPLPAVTRYDACVAMR